MQKPDFEVMTIAKVQETVKEIRLELYEGKVTNIFFHPLIAYPELAFDNDGYHNTMDDWFVTVLEFKRIIESLYSDGYVLIRTDEMYESFYEAGADKIKLKKIMLPEGKKPLLLSIDDLNYYDYMKNNGTVHKLILDDEENVACYTRHKNKDEHISYDGSIITLLESFVAEHPDFSHNSARGIIALTGYNGVLGYDTHKQDSENYSEEREKASKVTARIREMGWEFASHGYHHYDSIKVSLDKLTDDTRRWDEEVGSIAGKTELYIFPRGAVPKYASDNFMHLVDAGFKVFFDVGSFGYLNLRDRFMVMDRIHLDGLHFRYNRHKFTIFDVESVIDKARDWDK
jgi:peptidoglycan/xylan/chitin deacetylase (PgdA/CDA1 family)